MYNLTPADLEIQARARTLVDELIPHEEEAEAHEGELPAAVTDRIRERTLALGLHATNMPKELGGGGCSMLQQVLVQEQGGRATNALGWVLGTPPSWFPPVATPEQIDKYVVPGIRAEKEECYAITEEGAGSDVDAITATARRDGDHYILDGVKWHVTTFNHAQYAFFQAKLDDGDHVGDHAMFIVDLPSDGVRVVRTPAYTHTIAHHHPIVAFESVRVPAIQMVGREGDGMGFAYEWFRYERIMVASRCLGGAARLIDETTDFAKQRIVNGRPIAEFGAVQIMLADSLTELFAARSLVYETARNIDAGVDLKVQHTQCSMAKLYASEMANRVADRCVQIFGGRGYMRENVAERFFRELRVERIWEGTSEVQRSIIADQMVKRGPSTFV
jgi:alkylation response protein AidB-like acyl-CoA dehydrogenase